MPSTISCYDINVCTKVLSSILARFLLVVNPKLKASFISNLIFEWFHPRDAWCHWFLREIRAFCTSLILILFFGIKIFLPFLGLVAAKTPPWHTTASAPPTGIEQNDHQYSWLICLAQCGCAIVACGGTTRYFYLQFKYGFLSRFLSRFWARVRIVYAVVSRVIIPS